MIGTVIETLAQAARRHRECGDVVTREAVEAVGCALHCLGGPDLMSKAFDELIARKGWDAALGISACWQDIPGWGEV